MKKASIHGARNRRNVRPEWFTGKTWMRSVSGIIASAGHDIHHVHFESGSRTKMHKHNGNQILIATEGRGSLETFDVLDDDNNDNGDGGSGRGAGVPGRSGAKAGKAARAGFGIKRSKRILLSEGDIVHIPAGMLHTHGSVDKNSAFSHIAINVLPRKNSPYATVWYESDFRRAVYGVV